MDDWTTMGWTTMDWTTVESIINFNKFSSFNAFLTLSEASNPCLELYQPGPPHPPSRFITSHLSPTPTSVIPLSAVRIDNNLVTIKTCYPMVETAIDTLSNN